MPFDSKSWNLPKSEGLYNPTLERDACGVGFIVNIEGKSSHQVNLIGFLVFPTHSVEITKFFCHSDFT